MSPILSIIVESTNEIELASCQNIVYTNKASHANHVHIRDDRSMVHKVFVLTFLVHCSK